MRRIPPSLTLMGAFLLCFATTMAGQQAKPAPKASSQPYSLGVSLEVAPGHAIAFPVQPATAKEDKLPVIPTPGHKKVSGIRIYPFMSGDKVAVRVATMVPGGKSARHATVVPLGQYVLGHPGDSLKLTELTRLGLRPLTVTVVKGPFLSDTSDDPCCFNNDGLICCGATFVQMCANCPDCCAGFKTQYQRSSHAQCVYQKPDAVAHLRSRLGAK